MYPYDYKESELSREMYDSLFCGHCVPTCSDTLYNVKHDYHDLDSKKINGWSFFKKKKLISFTYFISFSSALNYSIVHIFFEKSTVDLYKQDVMYYWYEIISEYP